MIDNDPPPHDDAEPGQPPEHELTEPTEGPAPLDSREPINNPAPAEPKNGPYRCDVVDGLSPMQSKAILALLNEPSVSKAAEASGVGLRTLHKWLDADDEFIAAYRKARRQTFTQAISLTMRYTPVAFNVLAKIMVDTQAPYAARVAAATNLLRFGRESVELDDLAIRVEALERVKDVASPRLALHHAARN
jgi:hypothetical protein